MLRRCARSLGSSPWSGRTSSVKKSASSYPLATSRRSTSLSGWPTRSSSQRPTGSFGCASTTPASTRHVLETPYPLPRIDQIVDFTSGCDLLSFLDAYSVFHQIQMSRENRKHTAFVTVDGLYCYIVMPYGLRNALPTFVRAMNKTFCNLIRDIVKVYVDDIVVKTKVGSTLVEDLSLVFNRLRATRTKLNPEKCIFGVSAGK